MTNNKNQFQTETFTLDNGLEMTSIVSENEHEKRKDGTYEEDVLNWLEDKDFGLFIDVGAFCGYFSLIMRNNDKQVIAFEPAEVPLQILCENMYNNFSDGFTVFGEALSNVNKESEFGTGGCGFIEHKSEINVEGFQTVQMARLDDLLDEKGYSLDNIRTCLKIDSEGLEKEILEGAKKSLNDIDYLVIELHPSYVSNDEIDETFELIRNKGFEVDAVFNGHNRYEHNCNVCFVRVD